ncbi:hypothetical protein OR16_13379 [Cupriavidus basilensis OR16]|uniref:Uncharacterized protein n=1 Tax=Cupriavidus basilensis OR16 TaxID=1127483 RepID=H1S4G0_9BURK|nr:hypothetical protein [Cupriavidus basilensis]EHP42643.1 hypothetical protein OR16_13379 [Cupriavidus basilensis OR16]
MYWTDHSLPSTKRQFKRLANLLVVAAMLSGTQGIPRANAASGQPDDAMAVVRSWTILQRIQSECPAVPDERWRLDRIDQAVAPSQTFSARRYAEELVKSSAWQSVLGKDVQTLLNMTDGCGTAAMLEWQAGMRRQIDTSTQALAGDIVSHWPSAALQTPVRISVGALEAVDDDDPGYLRMSVSNPGTEVLEIALSGKDLHTGFCRTLSSADLPITAGTDLPTQLLTLRPGASIAARLVLDAACMPADSVALVGALIVVRDGVMEYRSFGQVDIPRKEVSRQ